MGNKINGWRWYDRMMIGEMGLRIDDWWEMGIRTNKARQRIKNGDKVECVTGVNGCGKVRQRGDGSYNTFH